LAYLAMLFNIVAWGMSWVSVRSVLKADIDPGQLGALRYLIASAVILPIWLYRGRPLPARGGWQRP
jgi:drug/metabolite transporter (DMT)-like permease